MTELKEGNVFEGQIEFSTNGNAFLLQEDKDIFIFKKKYLKFKIMLLLYIKNQTKNVKNIIGE